MGRIVMVCYKTGNPTLYTTVSLLNAAFTNTACLSWVYSRRQRWFKNARRRERRQVTRLHRYYDSENSAIQRESDDIL